MPPPRFAWGRDHSIARAAGLAMAAGMFLRCEGEPPGSIPAWWGEGYVLSVAGGPAEPKPLDGAAAKPHPFMAPTVSNSMHADAACSDVHTGGGPLAKDPVVTSRARGILGGECATIVFDDAGRLISLCAESAGFEIVLLDPRTLEETASYALPPRPSTMEGILTLDLEKIVTDTSGGVYFYLDNEYRVVLGTSDRRILRIGLTEKKGKPAFFLEDEWDLSDLVPADCWSPMNRHPKGVCDAVTAVLPDWDGRIWWVTRYGRIGTLDPGTGRTSMLLLGEEQIQNGFAVAEDGVYVVSDRALYGLRADGDTGAPQIVWREAYARGGARPGCITQGSGTTPTLLGGGTVAIADNDEPRINVLVYRRLPGVTGDRLVCKQPVFGNGQSATENSLVGWGRSVIAENNYGYENFLSLLFGRASVGGIVRVDIDEDGKGCHVAWRSDERSPSVVPKMSAGSGLLYVYTKEPQPWLIDAWYFTAIDFRTGETVFKILAGTGWGYDNHWAPITLGPDGTAYAGVLNGIISVRDAPSAPPKKP